MQFKTRFPALDVTTETGLHIMNNEGYWTSTQVLIATFHISSAGLSSWHSIAVHTMSSTMVASVSLWLWPRLAESKVQGEITPFHLTPLKIQTRRSHLKSLFRECWLQWSDSVCTFVHVCAFVSTQGPPGERGERGEPGDEGYQVDKIIKSLLDLSHNHHSVCLPSWVLFKLSCCSNKGILGGFWNEFS